MRIRKTPTWENTIKKYKSYPIRYFLAETPDDIIKVVQLAEQNNVRVRAVGSGHSFSDVALTNDYFVDIGKLDRVQLADNSLLKTSQRSELLVDAEAGITLRNLNRKLDKLNLAVINMGGIDHQTLA